MEKPAGPIKVVSGIHKVEFPAHEIQRTAVFESSELYMPGARTSVISPYEKS